MIAAKNPRIGEHIEIQYEVYRVDMPPSLQWYKGVITTLALNNNTSIQVTVRFEGSESFPECDESFLLDDNGVLRRHGKSYPFKLNNVMQPQQNPGDTGTSLAGLDNNDILHRLSTLESRLAALENPVQAAASPLYLTLCGLFNSSFKKYKSTRHRFVADGDDVLSSTWTTSVDCSFSDYKNMVSYMQSLSTEITTIGMNDHGAIPSDVTVTLPSFKVFCRVFSISENHYHDLHTIAHTNKKGKLISLKAIGSVTPNQESPSLPTILCIGGSAATWNKDNSFFFREHNHRLSCGTFACNYQRIKDEGTFLEEKTRVNHIKIRDITVSWCIGGPSEICRPTLLDSSFIGKLNVHIPVLQFNNSALATKICRWLSANRKYDYSSDSSSSND